MKSFRTYQLAKALYKQTRLLKLKGEIRDQLDRATLSIVLNLAEGSGKSGKDRVKFFKIAYASTKEIQAILELIEQPKLLAQAHHIAASAYKLIQNPGRGLQGTSG